MKHLVILGAGTAGTMVANRVSRRVQADWSVSVVDPAPRHLYQPGLASLPFGYRPASELERPRADTLSPRVNWIQEEVRAIEPEHKRAIVGGNCPLRYDLLVIASGARTNSDKTAAEAGEHWRETVHEPYTLRGALALRAALQRFEEGRLVVSLPETPVKGPAAPLAFLFLADEFFTLRGIRERALIPPFEVAARDRRHTATAARPAGRAVRPRGWSAAACAARASASWPRLSCRR
ncbi:MAG TPA: FAD-dependent oxidoreductase [Thermoanaerobaculia bacterium]|nr:FAD-dependent oxidoreductase [Thermoanaerobaculia bacterium]